MEKMPAQNKKGFTIPELMVLMLALSIMLAASVPFISQRQGGGSSDALPKGAILTWCTSSPFPQGYVLCDGNNGTPDLRNRYPVGAGATYTLTSVGGATTHTLTAAEIPAHTHPVSIGYSDAHSHGYYGLTSAPDHNHGWASTTWDGAHTHTFSSLIASIGNGTYFGGLDYAGANSTNSGQYVNNDYGVITDSAVHSHKAYFSSAGAHTHSATVSGTTNHSHSGALNNAGSGSSFGILPSSVACFYIMKK